MLAPALCVGLGVATAQGQSTPQPAPPAPKEDNPFPGDAPQAPASASPAPTPGQSAKPDAPAAKPGSDNPFPGEDTNVPIIPAPGSPGSDAGSGGNPGGDAGRTPRRDFDPDGDPVRSPDLPGNYAPDDGFSSSRNGLKQMPVENDSDGAPGKSSKNKTREQRVKEDLDVGSFYLERKDWKGAEARFQSAFALDSENPDAVWGLAEAERHLQLYKESAEHYKLFLAYDPDGKRGREARKDLEEVQAAKPAVSSAAKMNNGSAVQPK
jgi:hypothetical protein